MNYSRNFGSGFPNELIPIGNKKDIDDSVSSLISQYYSYIDAGNTAAASALYNENRDLLEPYQIDMAYINRLEEEIWNTCIATLNKLTTVVSDTAPLSQTENSFWLQEYSAKNTSEAAKNTA